MHQSIFCLSIASDKILILRFPPPRTCLSLFSFFHFSIFSSPLTLPDFTSASFLHLPVCCLCVSLCFFAAVRVSRTDKESVRFCPPLSLAAPYPNAENTQVSSPIPSYICDRKRSGPYPNPSLFLQPLYLPPIPVVGRDHKPQRPIPSRAVVITDPSLRPLYGCCH